MPYPPRCLSGLLLLLSLFLMQPGVRAEETSRRAGAILLEPFGSRLLGMGGAGTAHADDAAALFYNPAGLASMNEFVSYLELGHRPSDDLSSALIFTFPIQRRATMALGYRGEKPSRAVATSRMTRDGDFRRYDAPLSEKSRVWELGVGRFILPQLAVGVSARYGEFRSSSAEFQRERKSGVFGDLGVRYNSSVGGMVLAASLRNIGVLRGDGLREQLPLVGAAGFSYGRMWRTAGYTSVAADAVMEEGGRFGFRGGAEFWMANLVALRAGYDGLETKRAGTGGRGVGPSGAPSISGMSFSTPP